MTLPPFEQIVSDHGQVVLRVCRSLVGPDDAGDAWSETFMSALSSYPRLRPDSNIRGWLVTIAHRKSIDRLRANKRSPLPLEVLPETCANNGSAEYADFDLWRNVGRLPDRQRDAVVYHYIADLPYAQVAELVGTSEPAARRAAADGVAKLRTIYGKEGQ